MSSASLLVVDDEPLNLEIITEYLDGSGLSLQLASAGEEAWAMLDANPYSFDLIVLDRMMPGLDGIGLLKRIKADERTRHLPVVMQTAAAGAEQVSEGLAAGAYYYLIKPFEASALLAIVRAALSDHARWVDITQRIATHGTALCLIEEANFTVRTLEEATALAGLLAMVTAQPEFIAMGLGELLVNGIEHGNLGIDFETKSQLKLDESWNDEVTRRLALPENCDKRVRLQLRRDGTDWVASIADDGHGFEWQRFLSIEPERAFAPNGRGIALSRQIAFKEMHYRGVGNLVEVRFDGNKT
ncbi:MAG TPA: response regulator [Rhodocyclaceae bacterium]|nr:response regulator [Rhodocyclaceae bacterium]